MSLKLVADNGEAIGGLGITAELRDLADRIDAGEYPELVRIVVVIETGHVFAREIMGDVPTSGFALVGMFETAKTMTISGDM